MTDPQETTPNIRSVADSDGNPDPSIGRDDDRGSDVGGPAGSIESTAEDALTGTSSVNEDDDPDDQAVNPL